MRVNNVYDIDNKTYLVRLQRSEEKAVLLLESGNRIHKTNFEWPKNMAPSGFSMKMRKHLKNKRLESLRQLGTDRIVDMQFGSGEAAYHIILELYDRGNIILTDFEFTILNILRPHTEGDKMKFAVREKYPQDRARDTKILSKDEVKDILNNAKVGDQLKKVIVSKVEYGPAIVEHVLLRHGFPNSTKIGKSFSIEEDIDKLMEALVEAEHIFRLANRENSKGYIIQKREERPVTDTNPNGEFFSNHEFHPMLFEQHSSSPFKEFATFNEAVDEFFSTFESQKLELKAVQQEREAMKKLENVRKDHDHRLEALEKTQNLDKQKAELITRNQELVERAILVIQTLLAHQISWEEIDETVKEAAAKGDPVAVRIKQLKLDINHISVYLTDPYAEFSHDDDNDEDVDSIPAMVVDLDLALSAFANARKYYDQKRSAAKKQQKTIESQSKALKSAERKTKQTLKEVQTITNINKARKTYWFEKFFWFISSENYLVIGGRDQQQNELIVKRYMKSTDVYVHADIHGASSIVIKNPSGQQQEVPPKTLNEAGIMAICYSVAWEAKVVTNAYWVWGEQVSKTAPTGEYLTTGSFMVRGKKNFLPPAQLVLGLGFLFKLEDGSVDRHRGERKVLTATEAEEEANARNIAAMFSANIGGQDDDDGGDDVEVDILDESDEDEAKNNEKLSHEDAEKICESDDSSEEENSKFPDTHVKIQHFSGTKMNILSEPRSDENMMIKIDKEDINLPDDKPIVINNNQTSRTKKSITITANEDSNQDRSNRVDSKESKKEQQSKRGQKSKLKKIKEKYKDQDEEERKLRMEILQSSGTSKDTKKSKKKDANNHIIANKNNKKNLAGLSKNNNSQRSAPANPADDDDNEAPTIQADVDMIDTLTGIPLPEDELLFAVPVVAPYNCLSNYKFKVKLTPGTGKRGKAAKTAVAMFLKDRTITQREKDILKAVKDEQLARNLPGKVKLSAPKLQNIKK